MRLIKQGFMSRGRAELTASLARTFAARATAMLGSLALLYVLGRLYGPSGVGVYALAQGIVLAVALVARFGMDNALIRFVGRSPNSPATLVYWRWVWQSSMLIGIPLSLGIGAARWPIASLFNAPALAAVLPGFAVGAPGLALGFLASGFFKAVGRPALACLLENGGVALIMAGVIAGIRLVGAGPGLAELGWIFALSTWLIGLLGLYGFWSWKRRVRWSQADEVVSRKVFFATASSFLVMSLAEFMQNVLSILVAGWLLTSDAVGLFKAAQQAALVIGFVLIVINAVFPPRFARLYHQGDEHGLQRLARVGAFVGLMLSLPLLLACLMVPEWLLGLIGHDFSAAAPLLRIIALGQAVNVATGSVGYLLNMTGHDKGMRNISLVANLLGLIGLFVLIPLFGVVGAACSLALILIGQNLAALVLVRLRLGIWVLPFPMIFRGRKTEQA